MNDGGSAFPVKHTPGPWKVVDDGEYAIENIVDQDGYEVLEASETALNILWIRAFPNKHWAEGGKASHIERTETEVVANLQLAAAAPELLEALQWMVEHDETNTSDPENAYFTKGLEKAKAAIAKAMGE